MQTIRSTHLPRRVVGLAAVSALILTAAACGGDDDNAAGDGSNSFCEDAKALDERFTDSDDISGDDMTAALEAVTDLEPPAEIAEEWDTMLGSLQGSPDLDPSDPETVEEVQAASEKVGTYMEEECGISG
jgi:hypothetical protein